MLSRCRQSMLICSSKKYLSDPNVRDTLVGDVSYCNCMSTIPLIPLCSLHQDVRLSTQRSPGLACKMLSKCCGSSHIKDVSSVVSGCLQEFC